MIFDIIRKILKSIIWLLKYALSTVLVGIILSTFLLFTWPGNKLIVELINYSVPDLVITMEQRSLLRGGVFSVQYKDDDIDLNLDDVSLNLSLLSCASLCVDSINAKAVTINLHASVDDNQQNNAQTRSLDKIVTPFSIAVNSLSLVSFNFSYDGIDLSANDISAQVNWQQNTVIIDYFEVSNASLLLPQEQSVEKATKTDDSRLFEISPIEFTSPLNWQVLRLSVNKFDLAQGAELFTIQNVYGVAEQQASLINISQFNAQYTHYTSELSATLDLDQTNPISLNVSLRDDDNTLSIKANGDLNKLKIDAALHGENNAELKAQIALIQPNLPFELALSSPLIKYIQQEQSISLAESQINLTGDLNQYNYRIISKITYEDFPEVKLTGTGQGNQFQTTLQELVAETEKSKLAVAGNISWQENINANLSIISDTFAIDEFVPEIASNLAIDAKTVINANEQGWQVNLPSFEIAGKINNVPVELSTEFDLDDKFHFNIKKLDLHSGANQLAITGQLTDVWSVDGELLLTEPSSLDPHLSGQGNGVFSIKGDALKPSVNWLINLSNLAYKEIKLGQFSSQGQVDMAQNYLGNITINGSELNYQEQAIEQLEINIKGDLSKHLASLRVKSNVVNLQSKLTAGLDLTRYQVELEDLTLSHREFNLVNDRVINASFDRSSKATTVSSHCWKGRYSELCFADTRISPTEGELNLTLNELDLSGLGAFLPDTIITTGLITGDFNAKWQDSKVKTVSAELQSDAINFDIEESFVETHLPIDSVKIMLNGNHDNLKFDTKIASSILGDLSSNIEIKNINSSRDISGDIQLKSMNLANLKGFDTKIDRLGGELNISVSLSGHAYEPLLNGLLTLEEIEFIAPWLPVDIDDGQFKMTFDDDKARVTANLNDMQQGKLTMQGDINWQQALNLDMAVKGDAFRLVLSPTSWLALTPDINITLNNQTVKLAGQVDIVDGLIKVKQLPQGAVKVSDDEIIVNTHTSKSKSLPIIYDIDLAVLIANKVTIDSFGLKSGLEGDLLFKQQQNRPLIATGTLILPDGKYRVFGQELLIQNGELNFNGAIDKPYLNVKAVRNPDLTSNGVIVGVTLSGVIDNPILKVFSEPSMDEMMALHYLLTGRSINDSNSASETMLTQFLLDQSLARGGGNVSQIVEALGFNDVSLSSRGSGDDTKVEISGYVSPDIQVSYRIGIFNSLSEVAVRYHFLPQLYIEAISGLNNSLDMLYKFEFE